MVQMKEWIEGFFDAEGSIKTDISSNSEYRINYSTTPKIVISQNRVAGFFDGDGTIGLYASERSDYKMGVRLQARCSLSQIDYHVVGIEDLIGKYLKENGIDYSTRTKNTENPKHEKQSEISISSLSSVERFLSLIRGGLILKRPQCDIMLEEVIPRMEKGKHLEEEGFLEIMAWKDLMDSFKGGTRGKYNLEYFEELWDMKLPEEKRPEKSDVVLPD